MKKLILLLVIVSALALQAAETGRFRFGAVMDPMLDPTTIDSLFAESDSLDQILFAGKIVKPSFLPDSMFARDSLIVATATQYGALLYPVGYSFSPELPAYSTSMVRCGNVSAYDNVDIFHVGNTKIRLFSLYTPDTIVKHKIVEPSRFQYDLPGLAEKAFAEKDSACFDILVTNLPKHVIKKLFDSPPADAIICFDYVPTKNEKLFDNRTAFYSLAGNPKGILTVFAESGEIRLEWSKRK